MDSSSSVASSVTVTQRDQWMVASQVFKIYDDFASLPSDDQAMKVKLQRDEHIAYLNRGLMQLGPSFCILDANRPWLCYWILHSIALLGDCLDDELENNAIDFLSRCQDPHGGYGGGPGQLPHLATTYAAVNSLITLGGHKSLASINREQLYVFLRKMKDQSGGFRMHEAGEIDVRACYTAISVASILNILDYDLIENVGNYIVSCQTYEGGIAGEPGSEAHGGYTFCGLATMILINEVNRLDLARLIDWVVFRQGVECGFQGRTNKLVDGCYSFWQGGTFPLVQRLHSVLDDQLNLSGPGGHCAIDGAPTSAKSDSSEDEEGLDATSSRATQNCHSTSGGLENATLHVNVNNIGYDFLKGRTKIEPLFHGIALQQYLLLCSQLPEGGFRDKPGKYRDYYHTCYCLSGLSVCQYSWSKDEDCPPLPRAIFGNYLNLLEPIHPLFNVVLDRYHEAREFFSMS